MVPNKILYINYDPATLVRDEHLLMRAGYEVDSVFGIDGMTARGTVAEYASVLIDEACPLEDRKRVISWLRETSPTVRILPTDWVQEYTDQDITAGSRAGALTFEKPANGIVHSARRDDHRGLTVSVDANRYSELVSRQVVPVEFRLFYRGQLPLAIQLDRKYNQQIHAVRKELHKQLQRLWQQHRALSGCLTQQDSSRPAFEVRADNFARCGYRFLPLVCRDTGLECHLEILLLSRNEPLGFARNTVGINHRNQFLFDGLRMPRTCDEIMGTPGEDENPFYVLIEDDSVVNKVTICEDRLLTSPVSRERPDDVIAVIHVKSQIMLSRSHVEEHLGSDARPHLTETASQA